MTVLEACSAEASLNHKPSGEITHVLWPSCGQLGSIMPLEIIPNLSFASSSSGSRSPLPLSLQCILVTDALDSPAEFVVHRALNAQLKGKGRCVVVNTSATKDWEHWKSVASRSNLNLQSYVTSKSLNFIDAVPLLGPPAKSPESPASNTPMSFQLRNLYDQIVAALGSTSEIVAEAIPPMVILEDLAELEWIGIPSIEVIRFFRALRALCIKGSASLVVLLHNLPSQNPTPLYTPILSSSHVHIRISPLSSGLSGAVSGEVSLYPGGLADDPDFISVPRRKAMHYRLTDSGAVFFERGTGGGVL